MAIMQDCFDIDLSGFSLPTLGFPERRKKREAGTLSYNAWRTAVFTRDNYTCQDCGVILPPDKLEAHHLKPYSVAPELEHVVANGQTLCHKCHIKTDSYGRRNE
ncbi:hypothetical protein FACS189445_4670 [Spirochaetia bacterium]|nr:hypothetical protein FACS189445_4670 [Spirochaetia bacterium]